MATNTPEASQTLDLLEKNSTDKLDTTERGNIKNLTMPGVQKALDTIQKTTFKLSEKNPNVPLDTIIKNYHATGKFTGEVRLPNETIPIQRGSDLAAWIQIFLIAKGHYLISNDASAIGIDAVIGENTNQAITAYGGNIPKVKTTPNQTESNTTTQEDLDIDSLIISPSVETTIKNSINTTNLIKAKETKADIKKQQIFNRGKNNGILDENGLVRSLSINSKTKTCIITVVNQKTGKSTQETYNIPLENILIDRSGRVSKQKWVNEMYKVVSKAHEKKTAEQKKLATEKEKKELGNLNNKWSKLQKAAIHQIKQQETFVGKINKTQEYSAKYNTLAKEIAATKVKYTKAEYAKLAKDIIQQKTKLDKTNILTNYPNYIKERYTTFKNNVGNGTIDHILACDKYIKEADSIIKWQQAYEKKGMVKMPQLSQSILAIREKLVNQKNYLTSKQYLDDAYNKLNKALTTRDPVKRGEAKIGRAQKLVRLKAGTYKYNNQPLSCKKIFDKVNKTEEYQDYINKFDTIMLS